jgi:hypothetical protein
MLTQDSSYSQSIAASLQLLQDSFTLLEEKLQSALAAGIITPNMYHEWMTCFNQLKSDWLTREYTAPADELLLQYLAHSNREAATRFDPTAHL